MTFALAWVESLPLEPVPRCGGAASGAAAVGRHDTIWRGASMRFMHTRARGFISRVAFIGASAAFFPGCGAPSEESGETLATTADAFTELKPDQTKANAFYAYDNVINITINLSDATWSAIKTDKPPADPNNP